MIYGKKVDITNINYPGVIWLVHASIKRHNAPPRKNIIISQINKASGSHTKALVCQQNLVEWYTRA